MTDLHPTDDDVTARARAAMHEAARRLSFARRRLEEDEAKAIRHDGVARPGFVQRLAARREEVALLDARDRALEARFKSALADAQRRAAEREKAAELERKALAAETRADAARGKMEAALREAAEHRALAREHLDAASRSLDDLVLQAKGTPARDADADRPLTAAA